MNPIPQNFPPPPPPRSDPPQRPASAALQREAKQKTEAAKSAPEQDRARKFEDLLSKPKPTGDGAKTAPLASTAHTVVAAVHGRRDGKESDTTGKDSEGGDTSHLAAEISDATSLADKAGSAGVVPAVVKGRRGTGEDDDDDTSNSEAAAMDLTVQFSKSGIVAATDATVDANALATRISDLSALIAQTASSVTLDASGTATIQLSQDQLPGSQVVVKMDQAVILVTFLSNNASSLAALQARGGEVAQSLSQRMGQQIKVEVYGSGSDSLSGSDTLLGSWDVDPVGQETSSGSETRDDS